MATVLGFEPASIGREEVAATAAVGPSCLEDTPPPARAGIGAASTGTETDQIPCRRLLSQLQRSPARRAEEALRDRLPRDEKPLDSLSVPRRCKEVRSAAQLEVTDSSKSRQPTLIRDHRPLTSAMSPTPETADESPPDDRRSIGSAPSRSRRTRWVLVAADLSPSVQDAPDRDRMAARELVPELALSGPLIWPSLGSGVRLRLRGRREQASNASGPTNGVRNLAPTVPQARIRTGRRAGRNGTGSERRNVAPARSIGGPRCVASLASARCSRSTAWLPNRRCKGCGERSTEV